MSANKKVILSGSTTSGDLTLGNYIGAIANWKRLQEEYSCFYMVADLHSLTTRQDPQELRDRILSFYAQYLACGLDAEKNVVFVQSHVRQHAELAWVLTCHAGMGHLHRMTQFKEKSEQQKKEVNAGLFTYPALMAADILLYQTDLVPVGEDQKQHLELTRDLAEAFNKRYGQTFKIPEPYIGKVGARIMSLQNPNQKMSKSDPDPKAFVSIIDPLKKVQKKIKSAVTDSGEVVAYDVENKAGVSNLMTIHSCLSGQSFAEIEKEFEGKLYGHLKVAVAEIVCETLKPVQEEYHRLMDAKDHLNSIMQKGAERAKEVAELTRKKTYENLGLPVI